MFYCDILLWYNAFPFADALEYYIDNKYPEAREGVRIVKKQEE